MNDFSGEIVYTTNNSMLNMTPPGPVGVPPSGGMPPMPPPDLLESFKKYALVITSVIGMVGNAIVFYVFTRTKLKKPSTARYLAATAVADTGYLLTIFLINLSKYNKVGIHGAPGLCQLISFGQNAFPFLVRWYLTAVVVEKYIGVMWPRKKSQMCTVFRAKCVVISLAIMSIVCYLYLTYFFFAAENPTGCVLILQLLEAWHILSRMDAVINFAIPYIIMFLLTCLISYRTWQYRRRSMTASERFLRRRRVTTPEDKEFKTTPMLILLVVFTLAFCVPHSVIRLSSLSPHFQPARTASGLMMAGLFHYFEILNSAIKIFIYTISSNSFARQLANLFCVFGRSWKKSDTSELQNRHITNQDGSVAKTVATSTEGTV